jgi:hypothetical protein
VPIETAHRAQRRVLSARGVHSLGNELVGLAPQVIAQLLVDLLFDLPPSEQ